MKFLNFNKVLCVSPHPDDIEYGMAGTILKCKNTKFDQLCLSCGGDFDKSTGYKRKYEVVDFWEASKAKNMNLEWSPHAMLKELGTDAWINFIEVNFVNKNNYDAILVPPQSEYDSHFEHGIVSAFGKALIRARPISLIEFCTPSTLENWIPNVYVDITPTYKEKLHLLKSFKSQKGRMYFKKSVIDAFHFHYFPAKRGIPKTERYLLVQHIIK